MVKHAVLLASLVLWTPPLHAAGLSTPYGEVRVERLRIGQRVSFTEQVRAPFTITNTGDREVQLKLELLTPQPSELKEGYEPLPDLSWVTILTDSFTLAPQGVATTDLTIDIPDDPALRGRRFQCYLWAHTVGTGLGVGLKSRLLLSIADEDGP